MSADPTAAAAGFDRLAEVLDGAISEFGSDDKTRFDYVAFQHTQLYESLRQTRDSLAEAPLPQPGPVATAAWLNTHHAMLIEGIVAHGVTRTVRDTRGFERLLKWTLGGQEFSLAEIRYGIFGNRRPPYRLRRPFGKEDPRAAHVVRPMSPHLRLALADGARSGVPMVAYKAETLSDQLEETARAFVNDTGGFVACSGGGWAAVSPVFAWHSRDFGGPKGVLHFIAAHVNRPEMAEAIRDGKVNFQLQHYDWGLNKCVAEEL